MNERLRLLAVASALISFSVVWYALLGPSGLSESFSISPPGTDFAGRAGVQPLFDLVRIGLRALPGHELQAIWWCSIVLTSVGAGMVLWTTHRSTGSLRSASIAALLLVFAIDGLWAASTIGPAALALFLTTAALAATTLERASIRHGLLAIIGGISLGVSPLLFIICAAFWVGEVAEYVTNRRSDEPGTSSSLAIPLSWLAVPLLVFVMVIVSNPWIWDAPVESGKGWLLLLLKNSPDHFAYLGDVYTSARPPLWMGATVLLFETPLVLLVLAGLPLFSKTLPGRLRRNLFAIVGVCIALPWIIRSSSWSGVPINALWAPALAILAGSSIEGIYERIDFDSKRGRLAATIAVAVVVSGLALESVAWREAPGAYRNPLMGLRASLRIDEPILRTPSISPAAVEAVPASSPGRLAPLVEAYRKAGFTMTPELVPEGTLATVPHRFAPEIIGSGPFARPQETFDVQGVPILWREE